MNRSRFEDALIRNADLAHKTCRTRGLPALIGVPAYITGYTIGSILATGSTLLSGRWPR